MMHFLLLEYREKVLNNSRMQLINKGGYFGAADKFQKSNQSCNQAIEHFKQALRHSSKQANNSNVLY
jgi:hypothetical protein